MIKKLFTILLSLAMTLSFGICSFAEDKDSQSIIESFIEQTLKKDVARVDIGKDKMNVDNPVSRKVDSDVSLTIYKIDVDKDTNITLNYKSSSALFGIGVTPYNLYRAIITHTDIDKIEKNVSWLDVQTASKSSTPQGSVDLKLKKGENAIAVLATNGDYEFMAQTTGDLKTMEEMKVDEIYQGATAIKGSGLAGAQIKVMYSNCEDFAPTTVNTDNTFELKIKPAQKDQTYMISMKKDGYIPQVQWVQVTRNENFKTFTVNTIKSTSQYITGKGEKGATVSVAVGDAIIIGQSTVKPNATYSIKLQNKLSAGTKVTLIMSKDGFNTKSKTVTVKKAFTKKLTVNKVYSTSTAITGTGSPSATVKAYTGNKQIGSSKVTSKGTYSIKISKQSKGKKITVKMTKTGFATSTKTVTVK